MSIQFGNTSKLSHLDANQLKVEEAPFFARLGQIGIYRIFGKRVLDVAFVITLLPIAIPLIAVAALVISRDGSRPFYRQARVGQGGRVFSILKLRTMVPDAETHLESYLREHPTARREWNDKQKLDNDPRITRFGMLLRQTSMDELPQLFNVLLGDMSLVGPRPMMVDQRSLYPGRAYYHLRPGVTGLWQISDRNKCGFAARAHFDDDYQRRLSLRTDLQILFRTIGVVLRCTGR